MRGSAAVFVVIVLFTYFPSCPTAGAQEIQGSGIAAWALSAYTPPACVPGVPFADIVCNTPYDAWIEQFGRDGITSGCGGGNYCPGTAVTRDQMAVFIEAAMRGTDNWPPHLAFAWAVKNADGTPNPTASGSALLAALASIPTSGNDAPSAANPWLLKIGPGVFDLGSGALQMIPYVDVEGSGTGATILTATGSSSQNTGTVVTASNAELRSLTVRNTGGSPNAIAVLCSAASAQLRDVAMVVSDSVGASVAVGYVGSNCEGTITDSSVSGGTAANFVGILMINSSMTVSHSTVTLTDANLDAWGIIAETGNPTVDGCRVVLGGGTIYGSAYGIANESGSLTVKNTSVSLPPDTINGKYAIYDSNSTTTWLDHVNLSGSGQTVDVQNQAGSGSVYITDSTLYDSVVNNSAYTDYIAYSQLGGASKPGGGTFHCIGTYGASYNAFACP